MVPVCYHRTRSHGFRHCFIYVANDYEPLILEFSSHQEENDARPSERRSHNHGENPARNEVQSCRWYHRSNPGT